MNVGSDAVSVLFLRMPWPAKLAVRIRTIRQMCSLMQCMSTRLHVSYRSRGATSGGRFGAHNNDHQASRLFNVDETYMSPAQLQRLAMIGRSGPALLSASVANPERLMLRVAEIRGQGYDSCQ